MIIDCHLHHMPGPLNSDYVSWLIKSGDKSFGPSYLWDKPAFEDTKHMLEKMDSAGVTAAVATCSANMPAIIAQSFPGKDEALKITWLNDRMIERKLETAGRILPTAWINPCLARQAEREMDRTVNLGIVGFSVLSAYSHEGQLKYIDHPDFQQFWAKAAECARPVFIHFSSQFNSGQKEYLEGFMAYTLIHAGMDQLIEDTICTTRLILSGIFDRYPGLKVVMGQLGGLFPFMLERFDMLHAMYASGAHKNGLDVLNKKDTLHFIRRLRDYTNNIYVDTHSMGPSSIKAANELLGTGHVLFGSDYPITPDAWGRDRALDLIRQSSLSDLEKNQVLGESAAKLLNIE